MTLYLRQRHFPWGERFPACDERERNRYYCKGDERPAGKKMILYDNTRLKMGYAEEKLCSIVPRYVIYKKRKPYAEIVRSMELLRDEYTVHGIESAFQWSFRGNLSDHEYEITAGETVIASVTKDVFLSEEALRITIADDADDFAAISAIFVMEACIGAEDLPERKYEFYQKQKRRRKPKI